jgi:hypothetical protein
VRAGPASRPRILPVATRRASRRTSGASRAAVRTGPRPRRNRDPAAPTDD